MTPAPGYTLSPKAWVMVILCAVALYAAASLLKPV